MSHFKLTLLISSFVIPLILSATLLIGARKNLPKQVMGVALLNAFAVFVCNYFYFQNLFEVYAWFHSFHIATVLWIFPSVYLYVKSIVSEKREFKKELFHLVPGLVFGLVSAFLFYGLLSSDERVYYLSNYRGDNDFANARLKAVSVFRMLDVLFIMVQVAYYSVAMIRIPGRYEKELSEEFADVSRFSVRWVKWFNIAFVLVGLLCVVFYVLNPFREENEYFLVFFLFVISAFIWVTGIWSYKQQRPEPGWKDFGPEPTLVLSTNKPTGDELTQKLIRYFEEEQPFLQSDLNLTTVCKNIGTNRSYLSAVINQKMGLNFNAFVNQYRVQYVIRYAKDHPGASQEELAQTGGFGSVSSLRRAMNRNGEAPMLLPSFSEK